MRLPPYMIQSPDFLCDVEGKGWMEEIVTQLGNSVGAANCLRTLVTDAKILLEEKVDAHLVAIFLRLIQEKGPVERFLRFLTALCTCEGRRVFSNQVCKLNKR